MIAAPRRDRQAKIMRELYSNLAKARSLPQCDGLPCGFAGIDTLTTITCQYCWLAHSRSQQNQSLAIVAANPKRLRERLYWVNVSMPLIHLRELGAKAVEFSGMANDDASLRRWSSASG